VAFEGPPAFIAIPLRAHHLPAPARRGRHNYRQTASESVRLLAGG